MREAAAMTGRGSSCGEGRLERNVRPELFARGCRTVLGLAGVLEERGAEVHDGRAALLRLPAGL